MDIEEIFHAFSGRLIGTPLMKTAVCEVVALFPHEMIGQITKNIWFLSSPDDAWALTFRGSDIKKQHLIYLSDALFSEDEEQIQHTIAHEIGHVLLNHENSMGRRQTQSEIDKQEREADEFAGKYLP